MITSTPLSWDYGCAKGFSSIRLTDGKSFIYYGSIEEGFPISNLFPSLKALSPKGFIIRGVPKQLAITLAKNGCMALGLGAHAIIRLNDFVPSKSLSALEWRGLRKAELKEDYPVSCRHIASYVLSRSRLSKYVQIEKLFQTELTESQRFFFARCLKTGKCDAYISLSRCGPKKWHIEQMVRSCDAPVGRMEALLLHAIRKLYKENQESLSLGEVPFHIKPDLSLSGCLRSSAIGLSAYVASLAIRHRYNITGLYNFKRKFTPLWEKVYWIAWPRLTVINLFEISCFTKVIGLLPIPAFILKRHLKSS
ncbi:MAG: DUF2156 domain-containing protein [Candidatus Dadabacteria bacterium]|nr:MAG: DUF2156 domain-containing protein [Candidatus Dadabacteria bacterium]